MEMESNIILENQKLSAFDILTKALAVFTNINFILYSTLASLPLFSFLVYFQPLQQKFQLEILEILTQPRQSHVYYFDSFIIEEEYDWRFPFLIAEWDIGIPWQLIQQALLYLVPLYLLKFFTALVIASLASKICNEERQMSLIEMLHDELFDKTRLLASFITSVYVLVLSTFGVIVGFIWAAASYYFVLRYFLHDMLLSLWCLLVCVAVIAIYLAWNAIWNMSILISILEGLHGTKAFGVAIYVSYGNELGGFLLMMIFFAAEVYLRLPCLYFGCKERWNAIYVAEVCLLCFVNGLKWVVFIIYFHDCNKWIVEKRRLTIKSKNSAGEKSCV